MSILILPKDNEVNTILPVQGNPSPFTLTTSWQDMPLNHVIKTNGRESLGLWLDVSNTTKIYFRVLCTFHGSSDFFQLPNQFVSLDNGITVVPQQFYVDAATNQPLETTVRATCRTTGASGTVMIHAKQVLDGQTSYYSPATASTLDTTANITITLTAQWDTADAGSTVSVDQAFIDWRN